MLWAAYFEQAPVLTWKTRSTLWAFPLATSTAFLFFFLGGGGISRHDPQLTCRYFRTRNYFEVDVDIGSSVVAYNTVSLAIGYAKSLVVDIGFCIQVRLRSFFFAVLCVDKPDALRHGLDCLGGKVHDVMKQ